VPAGPAGANSMQMQDPNWKSEVDKTKWIDHIKWYCIGKARSKAVIPVR